MNMYYSHDYFKRDTLKLATQCLVDTNRVPFSFIIVKDQQIVGRGKESTFYNNDPTTHSEIEAIRDACKNLQTSSLTGCILYSSSEACSMCLSALHWAGLSSIYYSCSRKDVYRFGFPDKFHLIEKTTFKSKSRIKVEQIMRDDGIKLFLKNERRLLTLYPMNRGKVNH